MDSGHNDQVVKEYWDYAQPGCPHPLPPDGSVMSDPQHRYYSTQLNALFDSTHFKDGTMIVLKLKVWDSNGGYYEGKIQGPAYNKAYVLKNTADIAVFRDSPNPTSLALTLEQRDNYTGHPSDDALKTAILNGLPEITALYINSHGSQGTVGDCGYIPPALGASIPSTGPGSNDYVLYADSTTGLDVVGQPTISKKVHDKGQAYPPFNFVFVNACFTSADQQISNAFLGSGSSTDRAEMGFLPYVWDDNTSASWVIAFWDGITAGKTIIDSVIAANVDNQITGGSPITLPNGEQTWNPDQASRYPTTGIVRGDKAMKLHTVYGSNYLVLPPGLDVPGSWFRPL